MPVMEIYADSESFLPLNVFAYMFYPNDEGSRQAFIAHKCGEIALRIAQESNADEVSLPTGLLDIILATRGAAFHKAEPATIALGAVAGQILLRLIEMDIAGEEASVNKAIHLAIPSFERAVSQSGNKVTATSIRRLRIAWAEHLSVAHFWAAIQLAADPVHQDHWAAAMQDDPLRILALARDLLRAAEGITNKHAKDPIISRKDMWTLPDTIQLPGQQMACDGLSDEQRERLKTYTARDMTNY